MLLSTLAAIAVSLPSAAGFSVSWKVSVIGQFNATDKMGRKCTANLNHVYQSTTKVYDTGQGYIPGTAEEANKPDMKEYTSSRMYREKGTRGKITYKIADTYNWVREEGTGGNLVEGYEGALSGSGISTPVDAVSLSHNTATNEYRLWINFRKLDGGSKTTVSFLEYYIENGKKDITEKQDATQMDPRTGGQGIDMLEKGPLVGFLKTKGFAGMKGKHVAKYRMSGGKGAELPIEVQIEADIKRTAN